MEDFFFRKKSRRCSLGRGECPSNVNDFVYLSSPISSMAVIRSNVPLLAHAAVPPNIVPITHNTPRPSEHLLLFSREKKSSIFDPANARANPPRVNLR